MQHTHGIIFRPPRSGNMGPPQADVLDWAEGPATQLGDLGVETFCGGGALAEPQQKVLTHGSPRNQWSFPFDFFIDYPSDFPSVLRHFVCLWSIICKDHHMRPWARYYATFVFSTEEEHVFDLF